MKCSIEITPQHLVYDRSRVTTDWDCPRKRWWNYEALKLGIAADVTAYELYFGIVIHDAMAAIARGVNIDLIAASSHDQMVKAIAPKGDEDEELRNFSREQAALVEGIVRGFYKHVWPRLMEQYSIVAIEDELFFIHDMEGKGDLERGKFVFMSKPDLILEDKLTGEWVYYEYKTTSSKKESWINQWATAVQVHSTLEAVEQSLKKRPSSAIVQGLYKGYESYGKQGSPFCYGYHKQGNPPFTKSETVYDYKYGYRRVPTWELEGGVKKWVEDMPETVLAEQFPQTPPIFPDDAIVRDFFAQCASRELEIRMGKDMLKAGVPEKVVLNGSFKQKFDRCNPGWGNSGKGCAYRLLCHGKVNDPLKAGYTARQPHHELEIELHEDPTTP